ncbi:HAD family hydrolase [Sphingomonas sanguinis]|uniref:HAD family hydrolase n=1 Tax=Sphingomonas sanguinis TaxID=33051 RepID=A0A147IPX6_9SPHN|nr:HAD family hydrolase [Sphingomonas sanguinis]KTT97208.1 HAD family hydrolase [Sphingomonas sanguinis]
MTIELICLDADDTLWHNMRHFAATEEALVGLLAPFAEARVARATLEACEARNLRLYGYGAKGFTLSMIETAVELAGETLPTDLIARLLEAGRQLLAHPVDLLDGIAETIEALETRGRLVLVTKGDLLHQEAKLAASGLGSHFADVAIVSDKTPDTFRQIFARHGVAPEQAVMAGDSMRSDVLPALKAGAWAAYIPQPLAWSHEAGETSVDHPRFRQLERLGDLPDWIDAIG